MFQTVQEFVLTKNGRTHSQIEYRVHLENQAYGRSADFSEGRAISEDGNSLGYRVHECHRTSSFFFKAGPYNKEVVQTA